MPSATADRHASHEMHVVVGGLKYTLIQNGLEASTACFKHLTLQSFTTHTEINSAVRILEISNRIVTSVFDLIRK